MFAGGPVHLAFCKTWPLRFLCGNSSCPNWTGHFRYVVLVGAVILVPYLWGDAHPLFICRICPAGALEAGIPRIILGAITDRPVVVMSIAKWVVLGLFIVAIIFTYRPWCKVFCPLGGFLSLFNRISIFHLRFDGKACTECNTCRSSCSMGVKVEKRVNTTNCIRCMECITCGAIKPVFISSQKKKTG